MIISNFRKGDSAPRTAISISKRSHKTTTDVSISQKTRLVVAKEKGLRKNTKLDNGKLLMKLINIILSLSFWHN